MIRGTGALIFGYFFILCSVLSKAAPHVSAPTIKSYAALGDSYATGAGAGSPSLPLNFDVACGRFSDAYPVQVANSTLLNVEESRFLNLACGGASTASVLRGQAPRIGDSQMVTLTVGGNEVDFFAVLNECVYKWRPFSTCEREWQRSRSLIESSKFIDDYNKLVKGTVQLLSPGSRLLVTGYARFFNQVTEHCSHISFSRTDPSNLLTWSLRAKLNDLISRLNDVIEAVAQAHGAEYIDIDGAFAGHRFCEEGVPEPAPDWKETWFFGMNNRSNTRTLMGDDKHGIMKQKFPNPFKDFFDFARTFHPTSSGHRAIKDEILKHMVDVR